MPLAVEWVPDLCNIPPTPSSPLSNTPFYFLPSGLAPTTNRPPSPFFESEGLLKLISGFSFWGEACLHSTFLPFLHRIGETGLREQPFIWAFSWNFPSFPYPPCIPPAAPVTRGYHILLKRTISLIEHSTFGMGAEYTTMAFQRQWSQPLHH